MDVKIREMRESEVDSSTDWFLCIMTEMEQPRMKFVRTVCSFGCESMSERLSFRKLDEF